MGLERFNFFAKWEYWPSYMFYIPNVPYAAWLALKTGSLTFYTASNPAVPFSGNGSESKYKTLMLLRDSERPKCILIKQNSDPSVAVNKILETGITFPMILKPDIGFRGMLVNRITTMEALLRYLEMYGAIDLLAQEYIDYPNEMGIFYTKIPDQSEGRITSLTSKQYPVIVGDGNATIKELISRDERLNRYAKILYENNKNSTRHILKNGETFCLSTIGNHSKGTQFINSNKLIDKQFVQFTNQLFEDIPGWNYGRLDIKFESIEQLKKRKKFKILELNGIISEPTHIYDATATTYFSALREIRKHWKILAQIARANHKKYQIPYASVSDFLRSIRNIKRHIALVKSLNKN